MGLKARAGTFFKEIWSLQHGFFIDKQDNMILSNSFYSKEFDLNIKSFYNEQLTPEKKDLKEIELVIIDILDIGTRVYTFLNHILKILQQIQGQNVNILVADRPNPINGIDLEGNCSNPEYFSIVSMIDVPMRHGLTAAEFIKYGVDYYQLDLNIEYVTMPRWKRKEYYNAPWTFPSPNMPGLHTALVYPGAVLLEGTSLSEGRGTTRPFEMFGAPFIDNISLCRELKALQFPGVDFSPIFFKPEFSKFQGEICRGILIHIIKMDEVQSFEIFYELIRILYYKYPDQSIFHNLPYEFEHQRPAIDMICGSDLIRKSIENKIRYKELREIIKREHSDFKPRIKPYLMY